MRQGWRWYGPQAPVSLKDVRQAGATDIVTALHHKYEGEAWSLTEVRERRTLCEGERLRWSVCGSIHDHVLLDDIGKRVNPDYSCVARLKGLAALRGVMAALEFQHQRRVSR